MSGSKPIPFDLISRSRGPLLLGVVLVMLNIAGNATSGLLRYDRSAILDGELWRLLSGHFIHMGWSHLGMNLAGLALIWMLAGKWLSLKEALFTIIFSALAIGLGLLAINSEVSWYVGFSGILHGIWTAGSISGMRSSHWEAYALFILLVAKLGWEQLFGPLPGSVEMAGISIVVDAHLYGASTGLLLAALLKRGD